MLWWAVLLLVVAALIYFVVSLWPKKQEEFPTVEGPVRLSLVQRAFMTPTELEFLKLLEQAVPSLRFHAQVSMGALLNVEAKRYAKGSVATRNTFDRKMVDFVGQCKQTGMVIVLIELDDPSHDRNKKKAEDAKRDEMLQKAGYFTIRWDCRDKHTPQSIQDRLFSSYKKWAEKQTPKS